MTPEEFDILMKKLGGIGRNDVSKVLDAPSVEVGAPEIAAPNALSVDVGDPILAAASLPTVEVGTPRIDRRSNPALQAMVRKHVKRIIGGSGGIGGL